ncbi:MAG: hypothetical protein Q8O07_01715 [Chloroflexota bacterium]|nr:hypothetical protein [Chloroflexota bacterium]
MSIILLREIGSACPAVFPGSMLHSIAPDEAKSRKRAAGYRLR